MSYKMPSSTQKQHVFSQVPQANIQRSSFNRSHSVKTSLDADYLVPFFVDEILPGDTFNVKSTIFARMTTPIAPFMDNLYMDTFFFYVPFRTLWSNWKKFMGEQINPGDSISYTIPQVVAPVSTGWVAHSVYDYMGLPIGIPGISVNALYLRAYASIYHSWFRDENLINGTAPSTGDGPDTSSTYTLLKRCKKHDYFTSALPWPQKGTAVSLPLGSTAPVLGIGKYNSTYGGAVSVYESTGATRTYSSGSQKIEGASTADQEFYVEQNAATGYPNIRADLSSATAATINSLRQAFQLQKLLERDARSGTRYQEIVLAHFGVVSPDHRVQIPEYLGGSTSSISITPVPQTSSTTGSYAQGHLAAYGTSVTSGAGFTKSFTEHGCIIGLVSIRADLTYQQGIPREFSRLTRYDFYFPALSCLGEQSVLNKEIYAVSTSSVGDAGDIQNNATFGYQERWAEYRYKPSQITGKLRSTYSSPLDVWHLAQKFTSLPTLGSTFIQADTPISRVSALGATEPGFVMDAFIEIQAARPMPLYSIPGMIDHF